MKSSSYDLIILSIFPYRFLNIINLFSIHLKYLAICYNHVQSLYHILDCPPKILSSSVCSIMVKLRGDSQITQ